MNETQIAGVVDKIATMKVGRNPNSALGPNISQSQAVEMVDGKVSERTLRRYRFVAKNMPELVPLMDNGELLAKEAEKKVKEKKQQIERKQNIPAIAIQIIDVILDLSETIRRYC